MKRFTTLTVWLPVVLCLAPWIATAQEPARSAGEPTVELLRGMERRLDELERENRAIRLENARLLDQSVPSSQPLSEPRIGIAADSVIPAPVPSLNSPPIPDPSSAPSALSHTPGEGVTISMLNNTSKLNIGVNLSGLAIFSTARPFASGLPFLLDPAPPDGLATNTFDLHARQSTLYARFTGPEVCGLTPGGEILTLFFNDNITSDNYGLLVYYAYGELKNDQMRFAAGLQRDIFNPVSPTILPISYLYGSGNSGSYRGQIRFERYVHSDDGSQLTFQFGLSEPIATLVRSSVLDPLVEDNGWPNVEGRLAFGVGETQEYMGGRKQRPVEFGVSGVVGQIRITKPGPERIVDDVSALGCDLEWAVTDRLGMKGELFIGQTLGEYNAGVLQNYNLDTFRPVRTKGGYVEIYYYLHPQFHLHCGYGIDNPVASDLAAGQIASNQTFFNTLLWDLSKTVQIGLEVDYRKTNYVSPLLDADGVLVMTQFLWRF
jgi:hypothetical protein